MEGGSFEKFIIELGFDDKDAIKGIKDFLNKVDNLNKKVITKLNTTKSALEGKNKQQARENELLSESLKLKQKINDIKDKPLKAEPKQAPVKDRPDKGSIEVAKNIYRNKMTQATGLGVDTTADEKSINRLRKVESVKERILALDTKISKARLTQTQDKTKSKNIQYDADVDKERLKRQQASIKEAQTVKEASIKSLAQLQRQASERQVKYEEKLESKFNTRRFEELETRDPSKARDLRARGLRLTKAMGDETASPARIKELTRAYNNLERELNRLNRATERQKRSMISLNTVQTGLKDSTRNLIRSYASMFAVFSGVGFINRIGQDFQSMSASMLMASGTAEMAAIDLRFVREEALRLGLDLKDATDGFVKLKVAAEGKVSNKDIEDVFSGYNEFATAVGVDKFRTEKGMMALQQMLNKGQIMAEELKNQLAEQVPGALKVFEKALGVGSAELFKMMERGELLAEDVFPKLGKAFSELANRGGALETQLVSGRKAQQRFMTALQEAGKTIYDSGFEEGISNLFGILVDEIAESREGLKKLGQAFRFFFDAIGFGIKIIMPVIDSVVFVFGSFAALVNKVSDYFGNEFPAGIAASVIAILSLIRTVNILRKVSQGAALATMIATYPIVMVGAAIVGVIGLLDEVFSLFTKGRVGVLEEYLFGKDMDLSMQDLIDFVTDLPDLMSKLNFSSVGKSIGEAFAEGLKEALKLMGMDFELSLGEWFTSAGVSVSKLALNSIKMFSQLIVSSISTVLGFLTGALDKFFDTDLNDRLAETEKSFRETINNFNVVPTTPLNGTTPQVKPSIQNNSTNSLTIEINEANLGTPEQREEIYTDVQKRLDNMWNNKMSGAVLNGVN